MKVVIDTNVIISSIGKFSSNRKIFDAILKNKIDLCISNEVLFEYIEVLSHKTNQEISNNFASLISILLNVMFTNIYYKWKLVEEDADDNKFIDCYIASNSDFLVTNDKHFDKLKTSKFPPINIISSNNFIIKYLSEIF